MRDATVGGVRAYTSRRPARARSPRFYVSANSLKTQVDDVADAQRSLERSMVVFSKAVARTLEQIARGDE